MESYTYNAFISYKHAPLDIEIAKCIHTGLETFRVPFAIQKKYGIKNIKRVFRDQEELPIGSDLGNNISLALSESEYLIVICSPNTLESYWVCKEIETFISMHDREHVLAVLVEGEPKDSFPPMLLTDEDGNPVEPLAADLRSNNPKELKQKLKIEMLRLAAPLIGCSFDDLRQRQRERKIKRICALLCSAFLAVAILGTGFAIYNADMVAKIDRNYKKAVENQHKYMVYMAEGLLRDGYRRDAVTVGLEALPDEESDATYVPEAELLLSNALYSYDSGNDLKKDDMLEHEAPVEELEFDTDKCHLITSDSNNTVYVWDVFEKNSMLFSVRPTEKESGRSEDIIKFDHIGDELIVCTSNGVRGYSMEGELLWTYDNKYCQEAIINKKNKLIILESVDEITIVDIENRKQIKSYNRLDKDTDYSFKLQYDEDKNVVYTSCFGGNDKAFVAQIDVNTGNITTYDSKKDYIQAMALSEDGFIYVASTDRDELLNDIDKPYTTYLQKINLTTKEEAWCYCTDFADGGLGSNSPTTLKYRYYEDENNKMHREAVITANCKMVCIDTDNGLVLSEMTMQGGIKSALLARSGPLGYVALSSGNVEIINYPAGEILSDLRIKTDLSITDLMVANGVFAAKSYASPDILLMKYHVGQGMEKLLTADDDITKVEEAPDGKSIAITIGSPYDNGIYFIDKENNSQYIDLSRLFIGRITDSTYTKENEYFFLTNDKRCYFINPVTMETKEITMDLENMDIIDFHVNNSKTHAVLYGRKEAKVIDLTTHKNVACSLNIDGEIIQAEINSQGNKIYFVTEEELCVHDIKSGKTKQISNEVNPVSELPGKTLAVGNTGNVATVFCKDGTLRVINLKNGKEVFATEYLGYNNSYIEFNKDDSKLIVQGDDYYINVYDVISGEKIYESKEQYNKIKYIMEFEKERRLGIVTMGGIHVLETNTYAPVAYIDEGYLMTRDGKVLSVHYGDLYSFPYQTIKSLKEDAKNQFDEKDIQHE